MRSVDAPRSATAFDAGARSLPSTRGIPHAVLLVGPDVAFLVLFTAILGILLATYRPHFTFFQGTFLLPAVCVVVLAAASMLIRRKSARGESRTRLPRPALILKDWLPFALIAFAYENLHEFTYLLSSGTADATLRAMDRALFSADLPLLLERITTPAFTEYMTVCYALYFVFPTIVLAVLYARGDRCKFREFTWALSICFYLGFVGYVLVPAVGPRYAISHEFTVPLSGYWLTGRAAAAWNSVERVQRDSFPSLHTAISTISLIYIWRYRTAWRFGRTLLLVSIPLTVSLWASTLYLRYHWGVDVLAGWALAWFCCWAAPELAKWYYARKHGETPEVSTDCSGARQRIAA